MLIFLNERFPTALRATGTGLVLEYRLCAWRHDADLRLAGERRAQRRFRCRLPIFSVGVFVIYLIGAIVIPETKGNFR